MHLKFYNCPNPAPFKKAAVSKNALNFLNYQPDFKSIQKIATKYSQYKNVIIIGHGGSVSSFYGIYNSLKDEVLGAAKNVYFLSTIDPDRMMEVETMFDPLEKETLVVAISKSGEDITQLEALSQFWDFPILVITEKDTPLFQIAKRKKIDTIIHPPVGGRFSGLTEVALLPAAICGIDVRSVFLGGKKWHKEFFKDNLAWKLASVLFQLEQQGFADVFMPIYSYHFAFFNSLITQLTHETFAKNGLGQTYPVFEGPEWQHTSAQRFFGGRKNVAGVFISRDYSSRVKTKPNYKGLEGIKIKGTNLGVAGKSSLDKAMKIEILIQIKRSCELEIPVAHLESVKLTPEGVGEFMVFWQMFAVYSAVLRGVNPFDQPDVEAAKLAGFQNRLNV